MLVRRESVAASLLYLSLVGCAESTLVRSYPSGAQLYINNHYEGVTPIELTVPRSEFSAANIQMRLERDGYEPFAGTLKKSTCPGRIVGGIFTLGIVLIFKPPTCFQDPQDFSLVALPGDSTTANGEIPAAPQLTVEERLHRLQRLRESGAITNQEYEHYRAEILKGL